MPSIEDYMRSETLKMNWFEKLVGNYPEVRSTRVIANPSRSRQLGKEQIIKPSIVDKGIAILLTLFVIFLLLKNSFFQ